jgi:predicted amidophosphoribosyltransferase
MRTLSDPLIDLTTDPLTRLVAVWPHQGAAAELVRELKYGRATAVVTDLVEAMAEVAPHTDVVAWVPASRDRRRRRGFDQGELLARAIARRLGLPVRRALRRTDNVAQTARELAGRLAGPEFAPAGRRFVFKPRVLLVDDVFTTGSTMRSAASVLRSRGAGEVIGLVATKARVPDRPAEPRLGVYDQLTTQTSGG